MHTCQSIHTANDVSQLVGSSTWSQRRGDVLAFLFGGHMADLVDRNRVIEILEQMRDRRKGSCSRQAMIEATAMQYAIEVVKKVPNAETQQVDGE